MSLAPEDLERIEGRIVRLNAEAKRARSSVTLVVRMAAQLRDEITSLQAEELQDDDRDSHTEP